MTQVNGLGSDSLFGPLEAKYGRCARRFSWRALWAWFFLVNLGPFWQDGVCLPGTLIRCGLGIADVGI
jgi:hypothetical protein